MTNIETTANLFTGRWVGETQGFAMPAHIWEITQQNNALLLTTRWEGNAEVNCFYAQLIPEEPAFLIQAIKPAKAMIIDRHHFIIPGWCTNDTRDDEGPDYDVVFSRPGVAELAAKQAYVKYQEKRQQNSD